MMDKEMDDGEFWLPSDFLTDDFFAEEERPNETESDEDDSVAGLTRQMKTHSLLHEEPKNYSSVVKGESPKPLEMATSPQSTLCGIGSWSFSSNGGSPDGPSQVSSPPSTPFQQTRDDSLDLLYAAAGQVERLGLNIEGSRGLLAPPQENYQIPAAKNHKNDVGGFYSSQDLIQHQLQAARFYQLKRQQILKQQQQYSAAWAARNHNRARNSARPLGLSSSAWPPLQKKQQQQQQQQLPLPGSGMTAVFLNGGRRQSNGTGVFLPRRIGSPDQPRKKPTCSTVLLPARVVQALNLNLEDMGVHPRFPGCYVLDNDAALARSNLNRNQPAATVTAAATSPELRLPQEWTY